MKKILGLDLGTNSIGSALLEFGKDEKELIRIIQSGVRILPMTEDVKNDYLKGNNVSKAKDRTLKRGARRNLHRYRLRRSQLLWALHELDWLPEGFEIHKTEKNGKVRFQVSNTPIATRMTALELYGLRLRALTEPVSLKELGRIMLHLNQRRGYKPTKGELASLAEQEEQENVSIIFHNETITTVTPTGEEQKGKAILKIQLANGQEGYSSNQVFNLLIEKKQELKQKIRTNKDGSQYSEFSLINTDDWGKKLESTDQLLRDTHLTPGAYFYNELKTAQKQGTHFRIRQTLIKRHQYINEFNLIWERQLQAHPELNNPELLKRLVAAVTPKHFPEKKQWEEKSLQAFFRDFIIYYQRKLKSQKASIGTCRFEGYQAQNGTYFGRKVAPVSHPEVQEFRIWQSINNVKIVLEDGSKRFLEITEKERLYEKLKEVELLNTGQVAKALGMKGYEDDIAMPATLPGNTTYYKLLKTAKKCGYNLPAYGSPALFSLWHSLYSIEDIDQLQGALIRNFGMNITQSNQFIRTGLERGWSSLSLKAIRKMTPLMQAGRYFNWDNVNPEVKNKIQKVLDGEATATMEKVYEEFGKINSIEDIQGLPYWLCASLIYGDHRGSSDAQTYQSYTDIKALPGNSLRNSVVEKVVNETLAIVKAYWKNHGRPDAIRIELARDMRQNARERKNTYDNQNKQARNRANVSTTLQKECGIANPTRKDIDKYLLWQEAGGRCIYSGATIPISALFNGETDVDHILPRQRFFDDSYNNKILVYRSMNEEKSNRTAFEYMQTKDFDAYEQRVNEWFKQNPVKRQRLLAKELPKDFLLRQLSQTRYISRKVASLLEAVCPGKVYTTSGTVTDYLKKEWGLDEVFKSIHLERFQRLEQLGNKSLIHTKEHNGKKTLMLTGYDKRIDHRHHALDAITIAATRQGIIQQLNNLSQEIGAEYLKSERGKRFFIPPHTEIKRLVKESLEQLIVSHKNRRRILTTGKQIAYSRNEQGQLVSQKPQPVKSIRSALHEEQPYGAIKQYTKISIEKTIQDPSMIIIDWQRELLEKRIVEQGNDLNKVRKSLKTSPLEGPGGEPLNMVSTWEHYYVKTYTLSPAFSPKQANDIVDTGLRRIINEHLDQYNDPKLAFTDEGLAQLNRDRKQPILKVRVKIRGALTPFYTRQDPSVKKHISEGDNLYFNIHIDPEGKRSFSNLSFYEAVHHLLTNGCLPSDPEGMKTFRLQRGSFVYIPYPDENVQLVDWSNKKHIFSRIYYLAKSSGNQAYFLPHNYAQVFNEKNNPEVAVNEFGSVNRTEFLGDDPDTRIKIIETCIKINISPLGDVEPARS